MRDLGVFFGVGLFGGLLTLPTVSNQFVANVLKGVLRTAPH
jgi:fluoride ion exporter CrcB/FEX